MTGLLKNEKGRATEFYVNYTFIFDPVLTLFKFSCAEGCFVGPQHRRIGIHFSRTAQVITAIPELFPDVHTVLYLPENHRSATVRTVGF